MKASTAPRRQPRPVFYTREQLDDLCETIIVSFCMERYGQELNPIPTDALLQLLEEHAHDVDQTADLPEGIHGVTEYYWDRKPDVKIDARLTQQHWRETRRRSTLTHEYSPVIQDAPLWRRLVPKSRPRARSQYPAAARRATRFTTNGTLGWNFKHGTCPAHC